jgi:hypothetical protein
VTPTTPFTNSTITPLSSAASRFGTGEAPTQSPAPWAGSERDTLLYKDADFLTVTAAGPKGSDTGADDGYLTVTNSNSNSAVAAAAAASFEELEIVTQEQDAGRMRRLRPRVTEHVVPPSYDPAWRSSLSDSSVDSLDWTESVVGSEFEGGRLRDESRNGQRRDYSTTDRKI